MLGTNPTTAGVLTNSGNYINAREDKLLPSDDKALGSRHCKRCSVLRIGFDD